jgi:two-component system nitrate/nitrite response regulator NarL
VGSRCVSIVIADRQPVVLCGLFTMLRENDFNVVASCQDGATCARTIRDLSPDLALLDISLPGSSAFEVLAAVKVEHLSTRVVFLSASSAPSEAASAIARGAYGVIPKDAAPQLLLRGLRQVAFGLRLSPLLGLPSKHDNDPQGDHAGLSTILTERECEITHLVCVGLSNKEMGRQLNVSEGTIKVHLHHIYQKLAITNRTSLAALGASEVTRPFEGNAIRYLGRRRRTCSWH